MKLELLIDTSKLKWRDKRGRINPLIARNFLRRLQKLIEKYDVPEEALDNIDFDALIDPKLTPDENLRIIEEKLRLLGNNSDYAIDADALIMMQLDYERDLYQDMWGIPLVPYTKTVAEYIDMAKKHKGKRRRRARSFEYKPIDVMLFSNDEVVREAVVAYMDRKTKKVYFDLLRLVEYF